MTCIFVQIRCTPGTTYEVADAISLREFHSELYSTSGDYDLLLKVYVPEDQDVGRYVDACFKEIPGIERTLTTMTYTAF